MTESFHEQYRREKDYGAYKREQQGADTTLDKAERRHRVIESWVWNMRTGATLIVALLFGGAWSDDPTMWVSVNFMVGAFFVAAQLARRIFNRVFGFFYSKIGHQVQNLMYIVFGTGFFLLVGLQRHSYGAALTGAVLALTPFFWWPWMVSVVRKTDFARLSNNRESDAPPRIIE